jgi:3-oxoacyl-[acyl-carrier protein] reductase
MDLQIEGKRALVTGSSSGIGEAIAKYLASQGVNVVVHGRDRQRAAAVAQDIIDGGGAAYVSIGDLIEGHEADRVADEALQALGGIDILVNNAAGTAEGEQSWFKVPVDEWEKTFRRNVSASGRLIHKLAPPMKERGWGRVIQIGTMASTIPTSAQPDYGPSKAALLNMSKGLSRALAGSGVTVNTVSPGMIRTPGVARFLNVFAQKRGWDDAREAERYIMKKNGQSVHRVGEPHDIAYVVAFLASPLADFLNGINIHADGGAAGNIY